MPAHHTRRADFRRSTLRLASSQRPTRSARCADVTPDRHQPWQYLVPSTDGILRAPITALTTGHAPRGHPPRGHPPRGHAPLGRSGKCYCAVTRSKYDRYTRPSTFVCPLRARQELAEQLRVRGLGCEAHRASHLQAFPIPLKQADISPRSPASDQQGARPAASDLLLAPSMRREKSMEERTGPTAGETGPPVAAAVRGDCQQRGHHSLHALRSASKFFF
jgi:hypothetical protein